jgi:hypothetical protein
VHLSVQTDARLPGELPDGALLLAGLDRALQRYRRGPSLIDTAVTDRVMELLLGLHEQGKAFSYWQFQLQTSGWDR